MYGKEMKGSTPEFDSVNDTNSRQIKRQRKEE